MPPRIVRKCARVGRLAAFCVLPVLGCGKGKDAPPGTEASSAASSGAPEATETASVKLRPLSTVEVDHVEVRVANPAAARRRR